MRSPNPVSLAVYKMLRWVYLKIFMRTSTQGLNRVVLDFALLASGFNSHFDFGASGEAFFIKQLAKRQPKLCLDIGANSGQYSRALLELTNAHVIAFEPLPSTFSKLQALEQGFPGRLTCFNVGLADESGVKDLHYGRRNSKLASFSSEVSELDYVGAQNTEVMSVPVRKLDEFVDQLVALGRPLDFIKIDTEGYEYEVLLGGQQLISKFKPKFIQIEFNEHHLYRNQPLRSIAKALPEYDAHQLLPKNRGMVRRNLDEPLSNLFAYSNWVFVRREA